MARREAQVLTLQPRLGRPAKAQATLPVRPGPRGERPPMLPFLQEILDSFVEFDPESFGLDRPAGPRERAEAPAPAVLNRARRTSRTA